MTRPSVVKIAAWGDKHLASMCDNILPCLMAPGNLAALGMLSPTHLLIYTDRELKLQGGFPNVNVRVVQMDRMPAEDDLPAQRVKLAWTDEDSIIEAQALDADWFGFQADTLISDGFLARVKTLLKDHLAVAGAPIRTSTEQFQTMAGDSRILSARRLRELSLAAMHPVTVDYFVHSPPRKIPADPHQFLFGLKDGGFVSHAWQPCPFGVSCEGLSYWQYADTATVDCYLIPSMPVDRVRFHKPSEDGFYLTSLDAAAGIPKFGEFDVSPASIAASIKKFSRTSREMANYLAMLNQRFVYADGGIFIKSADEEETIAAVKEILDFVVRNEALAWY
jgi:hypothetical protein